jgi:hypothetical protein
MNKMHKLMANVFTHGVAEFCESRRIFWTLAVALLLFIAAPAGATVVSDWNNTALAEVRVSKSLRNGPPIVARALAIVHTCIYDAWAAYDPAAIGTQLGGGLRRPADESDDAHKSKAISFAAYRCLRNLYPDGTTRLDAALVARGYDLAETSNADPTTPAGVGNLAAQAVIDARANDGANQYGNAPCPAGRVCPTVPVTIYEVPACTAPTGGQLVDALFPPIPCVGPGGAATGPYADYSDPSTGYTSYVPRNPMMGYCTPLLAVCPEPDPLIPLAAPWPNIADVDHWQPLIFSDGKKQTFVGSYFERVTPFALTSADQFDGLRHAEPNILENPGQYLKYALEVLHNSAALTADRKLIVEYWADGPASELPPGHWGLFAQFVSVRDNHTIDQDAKMFFALHNASFDAGIVAWHLKRRYDGTRPITAIRHLFDGRMVHAFGGPGRPTELIPGEKWMPYNPGTNLTPPFPGYISGHATFSGASSVVLAAFTGSDDFGFSTVIPAGFGRVEAGIVEIPEVPTTMSFATFTDAAEAAALSRLYGGIHFSEDNKTGLRIGRLIGAQAWQKAQTYFNGGQ